MPRTVAKMTVFLTDMGQKDAFDRAFERVFRRVPEEGMPPAPEVPALGSGAGLSCAPVCTCVGVAALPNPAAVVEVELKVLPDDGRSWQLPARTHLVSRPQRFLEPLRAGLLISNAPLSDVRGGPFSAPPL
ncbi:MAG: RidA family protein [Bilophila wadsworthia]